MSPIQIFVSAGKRNYPRLVALRRGLFAARSSLRSSPAMQSRVLMVSRMSKEDRYKGHERLIRLWTTVRSRVPRAKLVFVGDGNDRSRLEAIAVETRVADSVQFVGSVTEEELASWYRDLVVVGVRAESAVVHADRLTELREDATPDRLGGAERGTELVRETWRALEEFNLNASLALEALFLRLREELASTVTA